jgi:hypothetical protein
LVVCVLFFSTIMSGNVYTSATNSTPLYFSFLPFPLDSDCISCSTALFIRLMADSLILSCLTNWEIYVLPGLALMLSAAQMGVSSSDAATSSKASRMCGNWSRPISERVCTPLLLPIRSFRCCSTMMVIINRIRVIYVVG